MKLADNFLSYGTKLNLSSHCNGSKSKNKGLGATSLASTILVKAAFLCRVLEDDLQFHHLAFRVGMLGLEIPRQPARSKALEVKHRLRYCRLSLLLSAMHFRPYPCLLYG